MKINNETKIGILAVLAIAVLILGFNFLKGKNLFDKSHKVYAVFHTVSGLTTSNPVTINGLQIGNVYKMQEQNADLDSIVVTINLSKEINIPTNSLAYINKDLLGAASISIELGNSPTRLKDEDTLNTKTTAGLMDEVKASLNPALNNVNGTLKSLDSLIEVVGTVFDPSTKSNFQRIVTNLTLTSASLHQLLNAQSGALAHTLNNMDMVTGNLAKQNENISNTISNFQTASGKLAKLNLEESITSLNKTLAQLDVIVAKANSQNGSLGLLLNDRKLYQNLENTSRSLNILMDDLRVHPKRYVTISIFGRKDKGNYLTAPLLDSTHAGTQ